MERVSSRSHPSHSLLGELRALANRSLSADVLVLDARALRVWASASGDGLLVDTEAAPALREVLDELRLSRHELLEALRSGPSPNSVPPPSHPEPESSGALGPFEVVEVIEDDGSSTVFRARLPTAGLDGLAVVRRIQAHSCRDDDAILALLGKTRAAGRTAHANVAHVFDVGVEEDAYWIVMENLRGVRLSEVIEGLGERGAPRVRFAASVCAQVADGLHAIHEQRSDEGVGPGLVHGHLSPRAVLVTPEGRIKLLPLATAAYLRDPNTFQRYASPEQACGEAVDRRTDVFALGVLLWELATGKRLLGTGEKEAMPPSSVCSEIPAQLESIILRALNRRPEERFATASELSLALVDFLSSSGASEVDSSVRAWYESRDKPARPSRPVPLDVADGAGTAKLRRRALDHLSSNASLESIRRGDPVQVAHVSAELGYIARSFARLYLLVLVFDGEYEPTRAKVALKRSLPRVQSIMSAIAADILS